jgi:NADPH:quinone reductase-like Zn-dependent oxidoreductase
MTARVWHFRSDIPTKPIATQGSTGVVEAVSPEVSGFEEGQAVSFLPAFSQNDYGVYAESAIVPAAAPMARPNGVDAVSGAAVWMPYLTAYGAMVEVSGVRAGDVAVLNAASSSLGLAAIHTINRIGATPIAVTRTVAKRQQLLDEGAPRSSSQPTRTWRNESGH